MRARDQGGERRPPRQNGEALGDEILSTGWREGGVSEALPISPDFPSADGKRVPDDESLVAFPASVHGERRAVGWLPSGRLFLPREVFAALLASEIFCVFLVMMLAPSMPWASLVPPALAGHPVLAAVAGGASFGSYVLLRLRNRRFARRRHLRGDA